MLDFIFNIRHKVVTNFEKINRIIDTNDM